MENPVPSPSSNQDNSGSITVILADDHPVVLKSVRHELEKESDFKVLAEAINGEEAVQFTQQLGPRVVLMDIGMPKLNGIEATRQIKATCPDTIVLVLTVYDDVEHILGILESGADGYLTKNILVEQIVQSIRLAVNGETVLSPQIYRQVLKYALRYNTKPLVLNSGVKLTPREQEVLNMAAKGRSNKQIASELKLGPRTVKSHLVDIFGKLNVESRTEAVIIGLKAGFLKLDDLE
jgi:two-component system, NarL family, response regulator LiaR